MSSKPNNIDLDLGLWPEISEMARLHYRPENPLPYHNYDGHVVKTKQYFSEFTEMLADVNVEIDHATGLAALEWHDAGYHLPHLEYGFESKEELSATIAKKDLAKLGVKRSHILPVVSAILATEAKVEPVTNTEKAVKLADMGNVFATEVEFFQNFLALIHEAHELGRPLPERFTDHCQRTRVYIESHIVSSATFVDRDGSEVSLDLSKVQNNMRKLGQMTFGRVLSESPLKKNLPLSWFGRAF